MYPTWTIVGNGFHDGAGRTSPASGGASQMMAATTSPATGSAASQWRSSCSRSLPMPAAPAADGGPSPLKGPRDPLRLIPLRTLTLPLATSPMDTPGRSARLSRRRMARETLDRSHGRPVPAC